MTGRQSSTAPDSHSPNSLSAHGSQVPTPPINKRVRLQSLSIAEPALPPWKRTRRHHVQSTASDSAAPEPQAASGDLFEDADYLGEVVTAIQVKNNDTVGCSFYVARDERLFVGGDMKYGGVEVVEACKCHADILASPMTCRSVKSYCRPTTILLPSRIDESIETFLDPSKAGDSSSEQTSAYRDVHVLETRPSHDFAYDSSRRKLEDVLQSIDEYAQHQHGIGPQMGFVAPGDDEAEQSSIVSLDPGLSARKGRTLKLSSIIDLESKISVGCAGAVLMYLQRRKAAAYLPREEQVATAFRVSSVEFFGLDNVM